MEHVGYNVVYDPQFDITTTDFNQYVVAMRNAGVKILFIEQMPENYAAAVVKALNQQNFHPVLVLGASTYSEELVPNSGGAAAIDGAYLEQDSALYLGEDASAIPAVNTFLSWVQKVSPGFKPDLFTLFGWLSAELFAQALQVGRTQPDPGLGAPGAPRDHLVHRRATWSARPTRPRNRSRANCYIIGHIVNGKFERLDDPPIDGPTHGYRCDQPYYYPAVVSDRAPCAPLSTGSAQASADEAAARRISRALRLAAWFLWMTPLAAALSIRLTASRSASSRSSASDSIAADGPLGPGPQLGADRLVARVALDRLSVALDLALDVCHCWSSVVLVRVGCGRGVQRATDGLEI